MIPTYEQCMLPLLKLAADGELHQFSDAVEEMCEVFKLTEEERRQSFSGGRGRIIYSRVHWASVYLVRAGLLERPRRGSFNITQRGRDLLAKNPTTISRDDLLCYPEFREFLNKKPSTGEEPANGAVSITDTVIPAENPEEIVERSYRQLRAAVADDLLMRIKACPPAFFENLVVDLLLAMGYGGSRLDAGQALGRSGDGGVDGIIKEDKLGLDAVYIQAKRWEHTVGRPVVQAFAGALEGQRARKGVLITTSDFSSDARDYVQRIDKKIVLIDGDRLAELMMDHGVGVTQIAAYPLFRVDSDYFEQE